MRLGFRKANNGSSRGKQWNPKMMSSAVTAASRDGTDVPWPPLWPGDDASGRGGIGPGGRGHRGAAERSGRGGALAVRVGPTGVGPTAGGEGRSCQAVLTTPRVPLESRAQPSRRRAFSRDVRGRGRLRDRQLRACALRREGRRSRGSVGGSLLGQRHGLVDHAVSAHGAVVQRLVGDGERRGDNPVDLRRELARARIARRLRGPDVQGGDACEREDDNADARRRVANRATNRLATVVSPAIVQSALPLRPVALHGRAPHAVRTA